MTGRALIVRGDAAHLPLPDGTVDLIVTSPPYFALRSYRDAGEHYDGQVGSEPTPSAFLEALWACTAEWWRVLKPTGSLFVNLGDKYAGSGGHNNSNIGASTDRAPSRYNQSADVPAKSLMGLPWRYANGCTDGLAAPDGQQWILRAEIIHSKPNGLPESVVDRVRRSHEQWFHLTKQGRYYSAVDEIREAYSPVSLATYERSGLPQRPATADAVYTSRKPSAYLSGGDPKQWTGNPLGKLPGSVWEIPSEPLIIPDAVKHRYNLPEHYAAFAQEWPRRLILGWSPPGICTACGEGRRPVVTARLIPHTHGGHQGARMRGDPSIHADDGSNRPRGNYDVTVTGYTCACPEPTAPTRPSVILDPFGGTGTVAGVARTLGRIGISVDLSFDYSRLADWRVRRSGHFAKTETRTNRDRQGSLTWDGGAA